MKTQTNKYWCENTDHCFESMQVTVSKPLKGYFDFEMFIIMCKECGKKLE